MTKTQRYGYSIVDRTTGQEAHFVDCAGKGDRALMRIYAALIDRTNLVRFDVVPVGHDAVA